MEERYVVSAKELHTVRFECRRCGTGVSVPVSQFLQVVRACPGCGVDWLQRNGVTETTMRQLVQALRDVVAFNEDRARSCSIRLELEPPRAPAGTAS